MRVAEGELTANKLSRSFVLGGPFCMQFLATEYLCQLTLLSAVAQKNREEKEKKGFDYVIHHR
jgi:hypothetical protein